jgi:1-acyl-sn-glycerol-3-phosphate acyltransferase
MTEPLRDLIKINTADMLGALGLERTRLRGLAEIICWPPAVRFARQMVHCDALVGAAGMQAGSAWLIGQLAGELRISGAAHVPATGPVLILSNHPGLYDTIALFAAITRADLRTIAADRPFLRALPHVSRTLINVRDELSDRAGVIRRAARHLRAGGAVLSFPAGTIEPDPTSLPGAAAALERWIPTAAAFARFAPELIVVPALVSGVLSRRALRHPVSRLRPPGPKRELLAAMLQVAVPTVNDATLRVQFGAPFSARDYPDPDAAVRSQLRDMIAAVGYVERV